MERWLLAGCCGLVLLTLSAGENLQVTQMPRFYGIKTSSNVGFYCVSNPSLVATVHWYKAKTYDQVRAEVSGKRIERRDRNLTKNAFLHIRNVQVQDNGVYFCKMDNKWGPGTQLVAIKTTDRAQAQYRTTMKDGLIILQALLLAVSIAALLLRRRRLSEKEDSIYEEPEADHIYEGLAIETCGGDLYEELSAYAQADGAEAPWE